MAKQCHRAGLEERQCQEDHRQHERAGQVVGRPEVTCQQCHEQRVTQRARERRHQEHQAKDHTPQVVDSLRQDDAGLNCVERQADAGAQQECGRQLCRKDVLNADWRGEQQLKRAPLPLTDKDVDRDQRRNHEAADHREERQLEVDGLKDRCRTCEPGGEDQLRRRQ